MPKQKKQFRYLYIVTLIKLNLHFGDHKMKKVVKNGFKMNFGNLYYLIYVYDINHTHLICYNSVIV